MVGFLASIHQAAAWFLMGRNDITFGKLGFDKN